MIKKSPKQPCRSCKSLDWRSISGRIVDGKMHDTCSECPIPKEVKSRAPMLGAGTMESRKRKLTPRDYEEACEKANRTGKDVYL